MIGNCRPQCLSFCRKSLQAVKPAPGAVSWPCLQLLKRAKPAMFLANVTTLPAMQKVSRTHLCFCAAAPPQLYSCLCTGLLCWLKDLCFILQQPSNGGGAPWCVHGFATPVELASTGAKRARHNHSSSGYVHQLQSADPAFDTASIHCIALHSPTGVSLA